MNCLYHSTTLNDCERELPVRITNSFPPRGIVAKILNNSTNAKGGSLYSYGNYCNTSPQPHTSWPSSKTQNVELTTKKDITNGFSPPPTVTEIKSLTRKTPRFYTVDSSFLKCQIGGDILPAVDKLIANSELTGLKEVYKRICKGNMVSLKSLIYRGQISQNVAFVQTSSPLRYCQKGRRHSSEGQDEDFDLSDEESKHRMASKSKKQRVLVPCPYFSREQKSRNSTEGSSPHILYARTKEGIHCGSNEDKEPIEPTVINLTNKLPKLPGNKRFHDRFQTKTIRGIQKHGGEGTMAVIADTSATSMVNTQVLAKNNEYFRELPRMKSKNILLGKTMTKSGRNFTENTMRK